MTRLSLEFTGAKLLFKTLEAVKADSLRFVSESEGREQSKKVNRYMSKHLESQIVAVKHLFTQRAQLALADV